MLKKCPICPNAITNHLVTGRQIDCPNTVCKFNSEETCMLLQGAALARDNSVRIGAICKHLGIPT